MSGTQPLYRDRATLRATQLDVTAAPASEPVTLDLLREHARIDTEVTDDLLAMYLTAARMMVEQYLGRVLITQTLGWTIQEIDPRRTERLLSAPTFLELPRAPVQSVTSVTVRDAAGNDTVVDPAGYTLDKLLSPARLRITYGAVLGPLQHVRVVFIAGYGAASDVPMPIRNAIMLTATHLYEHRGDIEADLPQAAEWLCNPYRIHSFGS